jgi:hypothetical protein
MNDKEYLKEVAKLVHDKMPDGHGFLVITAPFGDGDHRMNYISNIQREDAIKLVKEWLFKAGEEETWMKHIK